MTTLNFLLAHAVCRTLEPGDEIVVTTLDHDGNVSPWLLCAADRGLVVREVGVRAGDLAIDLDALRAVLGARTRVVAFTLASNAVGTIPDAHAIVAVAHGVGALAWADAVHYAPHRRIDVRALGVDVLLCSPYKYFGPHLGLAYGRYDLLAAWPADRVRPADQTPVGHRFETGTLSHEALAGFVAAVGYLASLGEGADRAERLDDAYARIGVYEDGLCSHMLRELGQIDGMRVYGIAEPGRAGGAHADVLLHDRRHRAALGRRGARRAGDRGLGRQLLRARDHGSPRPRGQGGGVRVGFLHYTTEDEVERMLEALRAIARGEPTARSAALCSCGPADVAELVDAHGSGPCGRKVVEVQVLSSACPRLTMRV